MAARGHVLEHFRQIVWYSLDNNLLDNALFVAERLLALNEDNEDSRHLLGLCLLRASRFLSSYSVTRGSAHLGCSFVFAQTCKQLEKYGEGVTALESILKKIPKKWCTCKEQLSAFAHADDHNDAFRSHLPDLGAVLCLLGHLHKGTGDNKRAMDAYIEALRINPYLWEAFDGLIELGTLHFSLLSNLAGVSLRVENCFRANSGMRALRESTQTTNINGPFKPVSEKSYQNELSELSGTMSNGSFQPIFNWGNSQSTFLNRFHPPDTPGYTVLCVDLLTQLEHRLDLA
jgi:anaphase-promoting complex subunit 3